MGLDLCVEVPALTVPLTPAKYRKNHQKQFSELNDIVIRYKLYGRDTDFRQILSLVRGLVYKVLQSYNIYSLEPVIIEDIEADCLSRVLWKALKTFNIEKGSFSTHYIWQMKSFVAYRKRYYTQRYKLTNNRLRFNQPNPNNPNSTRTIEDSLSNFHIRILIEYKREIAKLFE